MDQHTRKIAVLMPVYNVEPYIAEAIHSLLGQSYPDFDIFVMNDGSTDRTEAIIKGFGDPRIKLINNPQNMGLIATLNRGLDIICSSNKYAYIARMDGDDVSLPTRFEKQIAYLDSHPNIVMCGTALKQFGFRNKKVIYPDGCGITRYSYLIGATPMAHPTVMLRCDLIKNNHYRYNKDYTHAEDLKLFLEIFRQSRNHSINIGEVLYHYRWQGQNISHSAREHQTQVAIKVRCEEVEYLIGRQLKGEESEWIQMRFVSGDAKNYIEFIDEIFKAIAQSDPVFIKSLEGKHFCARFVTLALYLNRKHLGWQEVCLLTRRLLADRIETGLLQAVILVLRSALLVRYSALSFVQRGPVSGF